MIEIAVKFRAESVNEMRKEVKAFLGALQEYCNAGVVVTADVEDVLVGEINDAEAGVGYRYDNGDPINDTLRELCEKEGVDDWRKLPIFTRNRRGAIVASSIGDLFATTVEPKYVDRKNPAPCKCNHIFSRLMLEGKRTLGDLVQCSEEDILGIKGIGQKKAKRIAEVLEKLGLSFVK